LGPQKGTSRIISPSPSYSIGEDVGPNKWSNYVNASLMFPYFLRLSEFHAYLILEREMMNEYPNDIARVMEMALFED
jgi:hypothetical protein